jgi:enoyl-CoA hydratase
VDTLTYEADGAVGRITLDRPERGNGITLDMPRELAAAVEQADLDPAVHVIALSGNGKGFCGGYTSCRAPNAAARGSAMRTPAARRSTPR